MPSGSQLNLTIISHWPPGHRFSMHLSRRWLFLTLVFLVTACRGSGAFGSDRPVPAPTSVMTSRPVAVNFVQLDVDPFAYRNRFIRVTGTYAPLPSPECADYSGPALTWELVSDDLHLRASGHADVVRLVPEGTVLTADGFWRVYRGPLGCGKEPPTATVWYLETIRLVQPNPLPQLAAAGDEPSPRTQTEEGTPTPEVTDTTPTATPTGASSTPTAGTPTPSATPDPAQSPTPTPSPAMSPSATTSPSPGTPSSSPTATPSSQPTATIPGGDTPTSAPPTNTPGPGATGYPGPSATDTPPPY